MKFLPGVYQTMCGERAVVLKLRSINKNQWRLIGAITSNKTGATYIHAWTLEGESLSKHKELNSLMPPKEVELESHYHR